MPLDGVAKNHIKKEGMDDKYKKENGGFGLDSIAVFGSKFELFCLGARLCHGCVDRSVMVPMA